MATSPPPSRAPPPRSGPASPGMGLGKAVEAEEEYIFQAPPELVSTGKLPPGCRRPGLRFTTCCSLSPAACPETVGLKVHPANYF